MYYLKLNFTFLQHPYRDEPSSRFEVWSLIELNIVNSNSEIVKKVLSAQWDLKVLINWFLKNEEVLLNENLPFALGEYNFLAEKIYYTYEETDPDNDSVFDKLFDYNCKHNLRFAMRGFDVEDIYIGNGKCGYEISEFNDSNKWGYNIDLPKFFNDIKKIRIE